MKRSGAIFMGSTDLKLTVMRGASALALLALCACGGGQKVQVPEEEDVYNDSFQIADLANTFQTAPDEFSVVTKRPLELPSSFDALPVPEPGKVSTRDPNPRADARAALLSTPSSPVPASAAPVAPSATEAAILSSLPPVDPSIRQKLAAEQAQFDSEQELYLLDRVFPRLREVRGDLDREQLDGNAERLRLLEAGVTEPRSAGLATLPAPTTGISAPPVQAAPTPRVVATPSANGGPVLAAPEPRPIGTPQTSVPTLGVLTPQTTAAPELIYIPE